LWTGSAGSVIDLNPSGFFTSQAFGVSEDGQQVGIGNFSHALLWTGSADSLVDLNAFLPAGFTEARALGIDSAGNIVGDAFHPASGETRAILWQRVVVEVTIDIEPGTFPNTINPHSRGVVAVAILTTDTFDATTVDSLSVQFGPNGARAVYGHGHLEDVFGFHLRADLRRAGDRGI
jgi:hypothetical protein